MLKIVHLVDDRGGGYYWGRVVDIGRVVESDEDRWELYRQLSPSFQGGLYFPFGSGTEYIVLGPRVEVIEIRRR